MSISVLKLPPQGRLLGSSGRKIKRKLYIHHLRNPLEFTTLLHTLPCHQVSTKLLNTPDHQSSSCHSFELHTQDWGQPGFHLKTQMHSLFKKLRCISDTQHQKYESQLIEVQFVIGVYIRFRKLLLNETPNTFLGQHWYQVQFDRNTTLKMDLYLGSRWHTHFVFFVPESDHCLALSVSHWLNDVIETQTKN